MSNRYDPKELKNNPRWMKAFPFKQDPESFVYSCTHVANLERPILYVAHDISGDWQFLCGHVDNVTNLKVISLAEAYELDRTVGSIANMERGHFAERKTTRSPWKIQKLK